MVDAGWLGRKSGRGFIGIEDQQSAISNWQLAISKIIRQQWQ